MHVHVMVPGQRLRRLRHAGAQSESLTLELGLVSGFGGAEVACWPLISTFAGSNPAEDVGFLKGDKKSPARLPSEGK